MQLWYVYVKSIGSVTQFINLKTYFYFVVSVSTVFRRAVDRQVEKFPTLTKKPAAVLSSFVTRHGHKFDSN